MHYQTVLLNGDWEMWYNPSVYTGKECPWKTGEKIKKAVPGYWEEMTDKFAQTRFFTSLKINPEYGIQRYPMRQSIPDMALPNIVGNFFYRRSIYLETESVAQTIHFDGVQNAASVWINGAYLGRHEGYSAPFELQIPAGLLRSGENEVVLSVSNTDLTGFNQEPVSGLTNRAACQYTGGVTGDIALRIYPTPLRDAAVIISEDCRDAEVRIFSDGPLTFTWQVLDGIALLQSGVASGNFRFDTRKLELWSPENPKQYTLRIVYEGKVLCRNFGVRRLLTEGVSLRLNGEPYYLRGVCEHCYYPETVHPTKDISFYRNVISHLKKLGFNFIRFHTHVPAQEYMQAADELGMLIQVECPTNASLTEWVQIVDFCQQHPSVVIFCCGNERYITDLYTEYLRECAAAVHTRTDALFSPLSALRLLEYAFRAEERHELEETPFLHNPRRFREVGEFADLYNSYILGYNSYFSLRADPKMIDSWSEVYGKPRLSHEIGIHGTYTDLSLKMRYEGTRIGQTELFTSIEKHLQSKGLLRKAPLYFRNSCHWQRILRKHNFESTRMSQNLAGYDFLGPIDTHWHTFGYDVGMMNEFYELKPGETVRNVRMYNSDTVLMTDMGTNFNFCSGEKLEINLFVSHYGKEELTHPELNLRLTMGNTCLHRQRIVTEEAPRGYVTKLHKLCFDLPQVQKPQKLLLSVTLEGKNTFAENQWELYLFPSAQILQPKHLLIRDAMQPEELLNALEQGKNVLLLGSEPFQSIPTTFQIALAGRPGGNLATVIADHPLLRELPHEGFCGWQFRHLLEGGSAVSFESDQVPFEPIIEVVSSHKYAIRQAALFEFRALNGRLLVCSFRFEEADPAAAWLKETLIRYAESEAFAPKQYLDAELLQSFISDKATLASVNTNLAGNQNDKATVNAEK